MLMELGTSNAQSFHHKTTAQHRQKPHENNEILTAVIEPCRLNNIASVRQSRDPDHAQKTKDVEGQRVKEIKIAVQEVNAQIFMHRHHQRANKEHDKTSIHQEVKQPWPFAQGFLLPQALPH